jgi:ABC-type lipoprotein release transport system permease subunit
MVSNLRMLSTLAWRNLWRNYRRTLIMLAAIGIGVWAMIFMTALMRGMVDDMVMDAIHQLPGHVQIHKVGYRDDPNVVNSMPAVDATLHAALEDPSVVAWAGRVVVPAMISSERDSRGVNLVGIDPQAEKQLTVLADNIVQGRYLDDEHDKGLIIGLKLAERLETGLGKRVVVMSQDPGNEIADRGFRIVGLYQAKLQAAEEATIFASRALVQELLKINGELSEIAIMGHDYRNVTGLTARLADAAGPALEVLPWNELDAYVGTMLSVMDGFVLVWTVVIFLALSFGLVNTLVMAVFERVREIGLMLALGMRPAAILKQILLESLWLILLGVLLGDVMAGLTVMALSGGIDLSVVGDGMEMFGAGSVLTPALYWSDVLLANAVVIVLGLITSLLPAWRASRYEPIEAITKI